ncbi:putative olfactory receptor 2W6 [Ictidomys tridecemlineatus]
MEIINESSTTDFILLGFSDQPQLESIISVVVFIFYIVTLVGNTTIILVTYLDTQLHTPMYFFLSNLSFLDLCYTTSIIPQMLVNIWGPKKSITYGGCVLQFFFALDLGATECLLLAVMAYDHYAAICQPLHYTVIMHPELCQKMVLTSWLGGLGSALILCSLTMKLPRCGNREVDNFFCETPALIKMACVYSRVIEIVVFTLGVVFLLVPLSLILISYGVITRAVMRIKSAGGWIKVLNTCGSHLTVVTLFYGTAIYMYMKPQNTTSQEQGKFFTLFYTVITPSLNPLIYTLRNKDVKNAEKKVIRFFFHRAPKGNTGSLTLYRTCRYRLPNTRMYTLDPTCSAPPGPPSTCQPETAQPSGHRLTKPSVQPSWPPQGLGEGAAPALGEGSPPLLWLLTLKPNIFHPSHMIRKPHWVSL